MMEVFASAAWGILKVSACIFGAVFCLSCTATFIKETIINIREAFKNHGNEKK